MSVELPDDVLLLIFDNLDFHTKAVARQVCKRWMLLVKCRGCNQRPVTVYVFPNEEQPVRNCYFPKEGFVDGGNHFESWETIYARKYSALAFLDTFRYGTPVNLVSSDVRCLMDCLTLVSRKWKRLTDLSLEHVGPSHSDILSKLCTYRLSHIVTHLSLTLDCPTVCDSFLLLKSFSRLKSLQVFGRPFLLLPSIVKVLPETLERFWCPHAYIQLAHIYSFSGFLDRFGVRLKALSVGFLAHESLDLLFEKCSNLEALRIDLVLTRNPGLFFNKLQTLKKMEHFFTLTGNQQVVQQYLCPSVLSNVLRAWPRLKNLSIVHPWSESDGLLRTLNSCCPSLVGLCLDNLKAYQLLSRDFTFARRIQTVLLKIEPAHIDLALSSIDLLINATRFTFEITTLTNVTCTLELRKKIETLAHQNPSKTYFVTWLVIQNCENVRKLAIWKPRQNIFSRIIV